MKTVLNALKVMGKATAREIAARLEIDPAEAIAMLRESEGRAEVVQANGYWQIATGDVKPVKPDTDQPVRVSSRELIALLVEHGPQAAADLAKLAGIESKKVAPTLSFHMTNGRVIREKIDSKFVYSVKPEAPDSTTPVPASPEKSAAEIVEEIPVFTSRQTDLILPTAAAISSRLRKARAEVVAWEKLQADVRAMRRRYGKKLKEMAQ